MRLHCALLLAISAASSPFAASAESHLRQTASVFGNDINARPRKPISSECVIQTVVKLAIDPQTDDDDEEIFECELDPSETGGISSLSVPIQLDVNQKKELKDKLRRGELVSEETTLLFKKNSGIKIGNGKVKVPRGRQMALGKRKNKSGRRLSDLYGIKPMLVVRVTDSVGKVVPFSPAQVGDDIFGTNGDPVNLKSQMAGCSFDQLTITAGDPPTNSAGSHELAPGVIDVTIPIELVGNSRSVIRNAVTTAAQTKLGFSLPGPYEQVMYVLEGCYQDCGWAAYAYINSWNSVYQGNYYYQTGVQMHELGHNFGFAHSGGLDGQTYTDHTGLMGNPLYSDDEGKMCWNAAKTWQVGWYDANNFIFDQQGSWSGTLVGIADFDNNPANHPVVIKLETGTSTDQFIAFNRATGVNSQNDEADDEVTIVETGNNGEGYSQSFLQAHLVQGEIYQILNWRGSGQTLTITAHVINISANPGYADISVCLGPCATDAPTSSPTIGGTSSPTKSPTDNPTKAPTDSPTEAPTESPTASPTKAPTTDAPTKAPTTDAPTKAPTDSPTKAPTTDGPTKAPTDSPTEAPTESPTASPTKAPTTDAPTKAPTDSPTEAPTESPTASPTKAPTTDAPTKAPTASPTKAPTTDAPTKAPTTDAPTKAPTQAPTRAPTVFSCSSITKAKFCRRHNDCIWFRGRCKDKPTDTCSATNCSACNKPNKCRRAGCTWKRRVCF